jgi:hypothetical protein
VYINRVPLENKEQTAEEIKKLVDTFHTDLNALFLEKMDGRRMKLSDLPLPKFFNFVRTIPYRRDPVKPVAREIVARPYYLVKHNRIGLDCKKKAILIGSWLRANAVPFRFIGSSQRNDKKVHHIFPQAWIEGTWKNVDATYPDYMLFQPKNDLTFAEVL